jgi:hypothetical protein
MTVGSPQVTDSPQTAGSCGESVTRGMAELNYGVSRKYIECYYQEDREEIRYNIGIVAVVQLSTVSTKFV